MATTGGTDTQYTMISNSELELIYSTIRQLSAERDEVKGRLYALIQTCEAAIPFIEPRFVVIEIKAAIELAKDKRPLTYQHQPVEITSDD